MGMSGRMPKATMRAMSGRGLLGLVSGLVGLAMLGGPVASEPFVAGTAPSIRPTGAPQIQKFEHTDTWRAKATTGVSQPYPASLKFLDDQGAWFNPFIRPGMTGPYDIRGRHAAGATNSSRPK